eukprot:757942-Hanusia_phi.AAC.1
MGGSLAVPSKPSIENPAIGRLSEGPDRVPPVSCRRARRGPGRAASLAVPGPRNAGCSWQTRTHPGLPCAAELDSEKLMPTC